MTFSTALKIARRKEALGRARLAFEDAIREAVEVGTPKAEVARAAGISRPTLYAILKRHPSIRSKP